MCVEGSASSHQPTHTHTQVWRGATTNAGWRPGVPAPGNTRRALIERWWGGGSGNGTDGTEGRVDVGLSVVLGEAEPPEIAYEIFV